MVKVQVHSAPLWKRVVAYVLDVFLLTLVLSPLTHPFQVEENQSLAEILSVTFSSQYLALAFILAFFFLIYWSVLECWFGQSVGKIILGISVEGIKKKQISFLQAVIRTVTKLSSLLLFFDVLYMLLKRKDQRYFEVLSDTHVVEEVSA